MLSILNAYGLALLSYVLQGGYLVRFHFVTFDGRTWCPGITENRSSAERDPRVLKDDNTEQNSAGSHISERVRRIGVNT